MGIINNIKNNVDERRQNRRFQSEAKNQYEAALTCWQNDMNRANKSLHEAQLSYEKLLNKDFSGWMPKYAEELKNNPEYYHQKLDEYYYNIQRQEYYIKELNLKKDFIRPNTQDDISIRNKQLEEFSKNIINADPNNVLNLRIHATSIYYSKAIIDSGGIISSADRMNGFISSTNPKGEISVSSLENTQYSMNYFADMRAYKDSLPAGCVFVLTPKNQEEADMIKSRQMQNVYFHKHPEQLYGIVTTSENILNVKQWMSDNDLNPNLVYGFDEFVKIVEKDAKAKEYQIDKQSSEDYPGKSIFEQIDVLNQSTMNLDKNIKISEPSFEPELA